MRKPAIYLLKIWNIKWCLFFLICTAPQVHAQRNQEPVEITNKKVSIDGNLYYVHFVSPGQTLYAISKAYKVDMEKIIKYNPGSEYGLKINQALKIPVSAVASQNNGFFVANEDNQFYHHEVKKGQTLYSISKIYDVAQDTIIHFNPDIIFGLKTGTTLKIPKKSEEKGGFKYETQRNYIWHKVKPKETLYSLSMKYHVDIDDIIRNNKELMWGLEYGQVIKIPLTDTVFIEPDPVFADMPGKDSLSFSYDDYFIDPKVKDKNKKCIDKRKSTYQRKMNVALFIPLYANKLIELKKSIAEKEASSDLNDEDAKIQLDWMKERYNEFKRKSNYFMDFYLGTLVALDTLKKQGLSLNYYVFDTENDSNKVRYLFTDRRIKDMDIIFGPFFANNVRIANEFATKFNIPVIAPFVTDRKLALNNNFFFQSTPSTDAQIENVARYIAGQYKKNIVLLKKEWEDSGQIDHLKNTIFKYLSYYALYDSVIFKEVVHTDSASLKIKLAFSPNKENFVIIPSNNEAFVAEMVSRLNYLRKEYDITVFGQPSWQLYSNIDIHYFHNLNLQYCTPFTTDYDNEMVQYFLKKCREIFHSEPYFVDSSGRNISMYGFDITNYFLSAFYLYGERFYECLDFHQPKLLQSDYEFVKLGSRSGYENISISVISYENDLNRKIKKIPEIKIPDSSLAGFIP